MERRILHIDADAFYASVESLYHPELRGRPMAVCGDVEQRHGIILAKTPPAKRCGVQTGEPVWQAREKCRGLVLLPARYDLYLKFSGCLREIYGRYTDRVEGFGPDEAWADVTGSVGLFGGGREIAEEIRRAVRTELGITVSVGIAWNKIFAKLGSDYRKPDGLTEFTRENYREKLWPCPVSALLMVGPATARKLGSCSIRTIGQLARMNVKWLERRFGKWGLYLWRFANGLDETPVARLGGEPVVRSVGNSMTTRRDVLTDGEAWQVLLNLSGSVARRLRAGGLRCRTVEISVRDSDLFWMEAQHRQRAPTDLTDEIAEEAFRLYKARHQAGRPVRALGVRGGDVVGVGAGVQVDFLSDPAKQARHEKLGRCADRLRERFGREAVLRASLLNADILGESDPLTHAVHPVGFFR